MPDPNRSGLDPPAPDAVLNPDRRLAAVLSDLVEAVPSRVIVVGARHDPDRADVWRGWLSEEEKGCLKRFGAAKRRREFVTGRAAARTLLAEVLNTEPGQVPLRIASDGAVDVDAGGWKLSIAHSGPHAVAAVSTTAIGADLEHITERDPALKRFLLHPDDRGLVGDLPYDSDASLVLVWTLKEAVLKARRTGFRTSPKKLRLDVDPESRTAQVVVQDGNAPASQWQVAYQRAGAYWCAVAVPK
jgi:4'-phosphopantetheinyl transferase